MPELPEVETAARIARQVAVGRTITRVEVRHRAQRRSLPTRDARALLGDRVIAVERRGKSQRFRLASGRSLLVHFRMTGDWLLPGPGRLPTSVRAVFTFDDGSRLALDDSRALAVISLCAEDAPPDPMGPDAISDALTPAYLGGALTRRRIPIKVALLDQSVVAGIGNIYASESLWRARIDPRTSANQLSSQQYRSLVQAIRSTLTAALNSRQRYYGTDQAAADPDRFAVYDREGEPCRRCRSLVVRIVQAGRSTYYCPQCQGTLSADC